MGTYARIASAVVLCLATTSVPGLARDAQSSRATLTGTVYDPVGAPVEGVRVAIESGPFGSGVSDETVTDTAGHYRFERLPPGLYTITSPDDFAPPIEVALDAGQLVRQDIQMRLDEVTGFFSVCVDCAPASRYAPPDSLVREFAADREAAATHSAIGAEPSVGWEYYEPDVRITPAIRDRGLTGTVVLDARIETDGTVKQVTVASSPHDELSAAAVAAITAERWNPAMVRGVPVAVPVRLTIEFLRQPKPWR
jgi:TonB family protein